MSDGFYQNIIEGGFRYKRLDLSASLILRKKLNGSLHIHSQFKGHENWSQVRKSKFIESTLLGIPTNSIFCEENNDGQWFALDGIERLNSICDFMLDRYPLRGLSIYSHLDGKVFNDLSFRDKNIISDRYTLSFIITSYDTPAFLKLEFLKRIHSNDYKFNAQSARNYAYPDVSLYLKEIANNLNGVINFTSFNRSYDPMIGSLEIDSFLLYLICIVFIKHNIISAPFRNETIIDLMDRVTILIHEREGLKFGLGEHIKEITNKISPLYFYATLNINCIKERLSFGGHESLSMERFINYFIAAIKNNNIYDIMEKRVPKFFDLGRSSSLIYKELKEDFNDKQFTY